MANKYVWDKLPDDDKIKIGDELADRGHIGNGRNSRLPKSVTGSHIIQFYNGLIRLSRSEEKTLLQLAANSRIVLDDSIGGKIPFRKETVEEEPAEEEPEPEKPEPPKVSIWVKAETPPFSVLMFIIGLGIAIFSLLYSLIFTDTTLMIIAIAGLAITYMAIVLLAFEVR